MDKAEGIFHYGGSALIFQKIDVCCCVVCAWLVVFVSGRWNRATLNDPRLGEACYCLNSQYPYCILCLFSLHHSLSPSKKKQSNLNLWEKLVLLWIFCLLLREIARTLKGQIFFAEKFNQPSNLFSTSHDSLKYLFIFLKRDSIVLLFLQRVWPFFDYLNFFLEIIMRLFLTPSFFKAAEVPGKILFLILIILWNLRKIAN